jgi:hypothetical protein
MPAVHAISADGHCEATWRTVTSITAAIAAQRGRDRLLQPALPPRNQLSMLPSADYASLLRTMTNVTAISATASRT